MRVLLVAMISVSLVLFPVVGLADEPPEVVQFEDMPAEYTKDGQTYVGILVSEAEYEKMLLASGTPEAGLGKNLQTIVEETPIQTKLIRNDIIKEIRNIRSHFKAKFMLLTAAVVDSKKIEGKDGTDFLKFMLANYQGASWSGGTDIFPHDAGKKQSKELEHGMKIYLYVPDQGVRVY